MNKEDTLAAADRPWFEAHVRLLARPAFRFSLMLTQNPAIAEEILQEALTQLWATPTTPSEELDFKRYLYRVVASRATDYHRRQALAEASCAAYLRGNARSLTSITLKTSLQMRWVGHSGSSRRLYGSFCTGS